MRKTVFTNSEFYHVYNRGNNKREIFFEPFDLDRFLISIQYFNNEKPIGSIFEYSFIEGKLGSEAPKLVDVIAYCLNPNHFHLILCQKLDNGIPKFMHRLGTGYTNFFNEKYKNSGSLFQGSFKAMIQMNIFYMSYLMSI